MLTEKARGDRMWQGYPHLRQFLEHKALVNEDDQRASTEQDRRDRLVDIITVARLLARYGDEVHDAVRVDVSAAQAAPEEISRLLDELQACSRAVQSEVAHVCDRAIEATQNAVWRLQAQAERSRSETRTD